MPPGRIDRTYQMEWLVLTDSDLDDLNVILTAVSVSTMALGQQYPGDVRAYCTSLTGEKTGETPYAWRVKAGFQSYFQFDITQLEPNPLLRAPVWSITYNQVDRAVLKDLDDDLIENSAHVPFDPGLTISHGQPQIDVSWNSAVLTALDLADHCDCTNEDIFAGLPPTSCVIKGSSFSQVTENNLTYWQKKYTLAVRSLDIYPLGWEYESMVDAGLYTYDFATNTKKLIRGSTGEPLPSPSLLKNGQLKPAADDPQYLAFRVRRKILFSAIIP